MTLDCASLSMSGAVQQVFGLVSRWTEHDPMEIWESVTACVEGAMAAAGDVEVWPGHGPEQMSQATAGCRMRTARPDSARGN